MSLCGLSYYQSLNSPSVGRRGPAGPMPPKERERERDGLEELSTPPSGSGCHRESGWNDSGRHCPAAIAVSQWDSIQEDDGKLLVTAPVPTSQSCLYCTQQLPLPCMGGLLISAPALRDPGGLPGGCQSWHRLERVGSPDLSGHSLFSCPLLILEPGNIPDLISQMNQANQGPEA